MAVMPPSTMLRLPFKTAPASLQKHTVGNPEIGELEIPRMNDLSPNERIFIREHTKLLPDLRTSAVKMARAIASQTGQKLIEVYNALTRGDTNLLADHLEHLVEFQELMDYVTLHRRVATATAILAFRLVPDWTIESTQDASQIHPKLVEALAEFAQQEENGWVVPEENVVDLTEEDIEGKSELEPEPMPEANVLVAMS